MHISRRWFELCAITEVMRGLKSGDICIPGSDRHSDFREQFVSEEECFQNLASYGERSGVPTEPKAFVAALQGKPGRSGAQSRSKVEDYLLKTKLLKHRFLDVHSEYLFLGSEIADHFWNIAKQVPQAIVDSLSGPEAEVCAEVLHEQRLEDPSMS
jgi:hypothetical protein